MTKHEIKVGMMVRTKPMKVISITKYGEFFCVLPSLNKWVFAFDDLRPLTIPAAPQEELGTAFESLSISQALLQFGEMSASEQRLFRAMQEYVKHHKAK